MAQAFEIRHRRNGASDLRDGIMALRDDVAHLTDEVGGFATREWKAAGQRVNGGLKRARKELRGHPFAAIAAAAGAGLIAGACVTAVAQRRK